MKSKMNKYRFVVGVCGSAVLKTNIIKAGTAEEAAIKYLQTLDKEFTDEDVKNLVSNVRIVEEIERDDDGFFDVLNQTLEVGNLVAFVEKYEGTHLRISVGNVSRFTKAKVFVKNSDGKEYGFVSDENCVTSRIVKLNRIVESSSENAMKDALGQSIAVGDKVVYINSSRVSTYDNAFNDGGTVTGLKDPFVLCEKHSGKKNSKFFVVLND